jgi:hypothetical protein
MKKKLFLSAGAALMLLLATSVTAGDPTAPAPAANRVDAATAKAIGFLISQQDAAGAFRSQPGNETTMTALGIMALLAVGHQPADSTREGAVLRKAIGFILKEDRQQPDGYFGAADGSRMYGHGIITLTLSELLGMGADAAQDRLIRDRCQKAVNLILNAQKVAKGGGHNGGWRYEPQSADSDLSVSVWQVMALRSAKNAGLDVPKEAIDNAIAYLKRSYYSPRDAAGKPTNLESGCAYQIGGGPTYAMAAAGLLSLEVCGEYEAPEVYGSAEWLRKNKVDYNCVFFFYGTYYYAQGMYQRGGEHAEAARRFVEEQLLPKQSPDGSWRAASAHEIQAGPVYSTSLAILALAVKCHFLPIYQR